MIENIKNAIDELTQLKKEFAAKEQEIVSQFKGNGVIGLDNYKGYNVQVFSLEQLEAIANGKDIVLSERRGSKSLPAELSFIDDGVRFFTLMDCEEYEEYHGEGRLTNEG